MNEIQELVLTTLRSLRELLVDHAVVAVDANPQQSATQFPRADLEQMVEGTFTAMEEFFRGGERPYWDLYMQTVIPGILNAGGELSQIVNTVVSFDCLICTELDRTLADDPRRDAARLELVRFASCWTQAISRLSVANG